MSWKPVVIACGMVAFGFVVASSNVVFGACPQNTVRFERSVALPGIVLPAGEYSFQLSDMPDLVVVRSADCRETYYIGFTTPVERNDVAPGVMPVSLGQAPANQPAPVAAWYPGGDSTGYAFRY